jgi:hypothetical protein
VDLLLRALLAALLLFLAAALISSTARAQPVSVALVLLVDASGSIDSAEWDDQRAGTAAALASPEVAAAVFDTPHQALALTLVFFSGWNEQQVAVPWRRVSTPAELAAFGAAALAAPRDHGGFTSLSGALYLARQLLDGCPWPAEKRVVDASFDGINNNGDPVELARDELVAAGITINALPIVAEEKNLAQYAEDSVIGGPGAFVVPAVDHADYAAALKRKLVLELF